MKRIFLVVTLLLYGHVASDSTYDENSRTILFVIEGLRHDYIYRGYTPFLLGLREIGAFSNHTINFFPTAPFPNLQSMLTGLYPESHECLLGCLNDQTMMNINMSYYFHLMPIWRINELAGEDRRSAFLFEREMCNPHEPPYYEYYPTWGKMWKKDIEQVVRWMLLRKPPNLVIINYEELREMSLLYGPDAEETNEALKRIDSICEYLYNRMGDIDRKDTTNFIFLSGTGMTAVKKRDVIDIYEFIDPLAENTYGRSPFLSLHKDPEKPSYWHKLKAETSNHSFKAYLKDEIPEEWHFRNTKLVPRELLVADLPYTFQDYLIELKYLEVERNINATLDDEFGLDGYPPKYPDMWPFFVATGPRVKRGFLNNPFELVDIFPFMVRILDLDDYMPPNNGTGAKVHNMVYSNTFQWRALHMIAITAGVVLLTAHSATLYWTAHVDHRVRSTEEKRGKERRRN